MVKRREKKKPETQRDKERGSKAKFRDRESCVTEIDREWERERHEWRELDRESERERE